MSLSAAQTDAGAGIAPATVTLADGDGLDWAAIDALLNEAPDNRLQHWRNVLNAGGESLKEQFLAKAPIERLVAERARLVDQLIVHSWESFSGRREASMALVAVGGYGRGELHPGSDIDLLLLTKTNARRSGDTIAQFLAFLWDLGLEVGHSTRSVSECREAAKNDLTVATTLMESRLLCGPEKLYEKLTVAIAPPKVWPARGFFEAKFKEQQQRHLRYDDTAYNLEPNVKGSPGGLRDIQMIGWVTRRHFGTQNLSSLVAEGFLTGAQLRILREGRKFLWSIRFALHMLTGRREDRLLFDHQQRIAELFGYEDAAYTLAVEQLMQRYYRTVMDISRVNEMLLQLFQEAILLNPDAEPESLNDDFEVKNGFLQITREDVFNEHPSALLEMFLLLQQHPEFKGVSAHTIALIRRNLHLIDDEFRMNPRNHRLFLQIIAAPQGVTHELRRMNTYGVLGQYIPNFGRIVGRMQYDLFHAYTVDAHTLFVVSNLRRFALTRFDHEFPTCSEIMQNLENPMIAYLAGLFHDIAKGRGGDHSELGAISAEVFCLEHGMSVYDSKLVAWLVQNHLKLSMTAQKKDINDPEVIREFAELVGDEMHLDYLYLLTVADVRATNPKLWNDWKAQLLEETYKLTRRALRQGLEQPVEKEQLLAERREQTLALLNITPEQRDYLAKVWDRFGDDYLLSCRPDELAWHARLILQEENQDGETLVEVVNQPNVSGTTVLIYAPQVHYTFAIATAVIDEFGLSVADARIIPLENDCSLSICTIHEQDGQDISEDARRHKLCQRLSKAVRDEEDSKNLVTRKAPRQVRMFSTPSTVSFSTDEARGRTSMEIVTGDQPGLAAKISRVLRRQDHYIRMAKLVTVGERAEDVFYITDNNSRPLSEAQQNDLREALIQSIDGKEQQPDN